MSKFAKGNNSKNIFYKVWPFNSLFILYQLTKLETPSYSFWDILITKFNSDPLKGA